MPKRKRKDETTRARERIRYLEMQLDARLGTVTDRVRWQVERDALRTARAHERFRRTGTLPAHLIHWLLGQMEKLNHSQIERLHQGDILADLIAALQERGESDGRDPHSGDHGAGGGVRGVRADGDGGEAGAAPA